MSEFFYDIVIEAIVTIMETIQERGVDLTVHRQWTTTWFYLPSIRHYEIEPISSYSVK